MKTRVLSAVPIALAGWVGAGNAAGLLPYQDAEAVALGGDIYESHCASCHGTDLAGEPDWRARGEDGLLPAPPHNETGHTWHHPDEQLFDLTKNGVTAALARRGMDYESSMIGFGDVLSDAEILAVLAYIKSTWPPQVIETHNKINAGQ